jgi:hypothetical protein
MSGEHEQRFSLGRWSRRKLDAASTVTAPADAAPTLPAPAAPATPIAPAPVELPPVDSLTFDSDFTAFLRPEVDADLKRAALKQLFRDPRFNVMDGLDTYIDDYTKADPIPEDMLAGLMQRFVNASAVDEAPAVPADERDAAAQSLEPPPFGAIGAEAAPVEGAGESDVPSPASGEAAPAQRETSEGVAPSPGVDAEQTADDLAPRAAGDNAR